MLMLGRRCLSLNHPGLAWSVERQAIRRPVNRNLFNVQPSIQRRPLRLEPIKAVKMASGPPYHALTYYTFYTPNGLKPAIVLEELGLDYKCELVDITKNVQKEDWYLKINPNGRIPALKDGDLRVFESGAIMLYLTDKYDPDKKISYPYGTPDYYEMMSWLMFQMGGAACCPQN